MFIQLESELLLRLSIKNLLGPGTADSRRGYGVGLGTSTAGFDVCQVILPRRF